MPAATMRPFFLMADTPSSGLRSRIPRLFQAAKKPRHGPCRQASLGPPKVAYRRPCLISAPSHNGCDQCRMDAITAERLAANQSAAWEEAMSDKIYDVPPEW